jgi:hypothetical protein
MNVVRIPTTEIEEGDRIQLVGDETGMGFRSVLDIVEEPMVRVLTLDGEPWKHASRGMTNVLRVRRYGQVVEAVSA